MTSEKDRQRVVELYESGVSCNAIAEKKLWWLSKSQVRTIVRNAGIKTRTIQEALQLRFWEIRALEPLVLHLYGKKYGSDTIGRHLGINRATVLNIVHKYGKVRTPDEARAIQKRQIHRRFFIPHGTKTAIKTPCDGKLHDRHTCAKLYADGLSPSKIAAQIGWQRHRVKYALRALQLPMRSKKEAAGLRHSFLHAKEKKILAFYEQSGSLNVTASQTGVGKTTIYRMLVKYEKIKSPRKPA